MTPSQIIAIVRDVVILAALGFVVFWIWRSGEDRVKVSDMAAVEKQLAANATEIGKWRDQATKAEEQRNADTQTIRADISSHSAPILVRPPAPAPRTGSLPSPASGAGCPSPIGGAADGGARGSTSTVDLRPAISALELKYESALADCRAALAKWPK